MVKKKLGRKEYIKVIAFVVLATIAIFATVLFLVTKGSDAPSAAQDDTTTTIIAAPITEGEALCLPHKNTDGPQTMECALGIKDSKGDNYVISDTDPSQVNVAKLQTGKMYKVVGDIEKTEDSSYQAVGTVHVSEITEL